MSQGAAGGGAEWSGLVAELAAFRAGPLGGDPPNRALARAAKVSPDTIGHWLAPDRFPKDVYKFLAVVHAVANRASARGVTPGGGTAGLLEEDRWRQAHQAENERRAGVVSAGVQRGQAARALAGPPAGRPLEEVTDPFGLEVHRSIELHDPQPGTPTLTTYVQREHDQVLAGVVTTAAEGSSRIAVLVGGSSTGKTRACWEALQLLRDQDPPWRLWHPIDPSRPAAALRELHTIGPRTVVWLNEAQFYLGEAAGKLGERVATGLRELLRDSFRAPVLVLATLWPQFWDDLTARPDCGPDPHADVRELLAGHDIAVPVVFTEKNLEEKLQELKRAADRRLVLAAKWARDGQVTQFLAGAPELVSRYRNAPPQAAALIRAAMDARRLGLGVGLPQAFLAAAAPGYLTGAEWDVQEDDWLKQALAWTTDRKRRFVMLTRIRSRPAGPRTAGSGSPVRSGQVGGGQESIASGPLYRLADYLDQYGRQDRNGQIPPESFWDAAVDHADPGDQVALARAARRYGLYRHAARLLRKADASGEMLAHSQLNHYLRDCVRRKRANWHPYMWDRDRYRDQLRLLYGILSGKSAEIWRPFGPDHPGAIAVELVDLLDANADQQIAALISRDPAAHATLNEDGYDPGFVSYLLEALRDARADQQVTKLADRAAEGPLTGRDSVARLLYVLQREGRQKQADTLARRLPEAGMFELFQEAQDRNHWNRFRFGWDPNKRGPAAPWDWDDPERALPFDIDPERAPPLEIDTVPHVQPDWPFGHEVMTADEVS